MQVVLEAIDKEAAIPPIHLGDCLYRMEGKGRGTVRSIRLHTTAKIFKDI